MKDLQTHTRHNKNKRGLLRYLEFRECSSPCRISSPCILFCTNTEVFFPPFSKIVTWSRALNPDLHRTIRSPKISSNFQEYVNSRLRATFFSITYRFSGFHVASVKEMILIEGIPKC